MYKNIFIAVVILLLLLFLFNKKTYNSKTVTVTKVDTVYTIKKIVKYKKGDVISYKIIDSVPYFINIHDTAYIVKDYNTVRNYKDTIILDSNRFVINDTITNNKIIGRSLEMNLYDKKIIVTNTITIRDKNAIYIGGDLTSFNGRLEPNVGIGFKMPSGLFMARYGTLGYSLGYYKKL